MATRIREKALARRKNKDNRPQGVVKYVRISPTKVRFVLDNIRGKKAEEALAMMQNVPHKAGDILVKLIKSVMANAEVKGLNKADLIIKETWVSPGPTMKRINIRARGRADRVEKRSSHITMIMEEVSAGEVK
ncbi:MAG: 50S ribosomal protein L22 [Clostridia bacterium]|nr:50S ribosomal protein L22 [Clostridia bacterium]